MVYPWLVVDSVFTAAVNGDTLSGIGAVVGLRARIVETGGDREAVGWVQIEAADDVALENVGDSSPATAQSGHGSDERTNEREMR